jgi:hypothetical protein
MCLVFLSLDIWIKTTHQLSVTVLHFMDITHLRGFCKYLAERSSENITHNYGIYSKQDIYAKTDHS